MIHPEHIVKALFETFDQSARASFQNFLKYNAGITKWFVSADYCLHDSTRPNNVFAFSVIPYNDCFEQLKADIRTGLPRDLKQTKAISAEAKKLLCDPMRFHFAFMLKVPPRVFYDGDGSKAIELARACIDRTLVDMVSHGRSAATVDILKLLKREAQARSFNLKLLADMFLLSHLFSFVTLALARDNPASVIGWMSDRDKMTEAFGGVLWVIANENVRGLAQRLGVTIPAEGINIAVPTPPVAVAVAAVGEVGAAPGDAAQAGAPAAPISNPMWFDEFIRIPDYIAGALAVWDLHNNILPPTHPKYIELAEDVIATANNMAVITIRYTHEFQAGRMVFAKVPPPKRPYNRRSAKPWR